MNSSHKKETPFFYDNQLIGHCWVYQKTFVFFGNQWGSLETIKKAFPQLELFHLNQVHGDKITEGSALQQEADGHWTSSPHSALVIKTADCLPIMIHTPHKIIALHAGWRGLEAEIILKALKTIRPHHSCAAYIGPHIGPTSFEVDIELAQHLDQIYLKHEPESFSLPLSAQSPHPKKNKAFFHLSKLAQAQLLSTGIESIYIHPADTYQDQHYFSYRREPSTQKRQYSFIASIPKAI